MKKFFLFLFIISINISVAQLPIGGWRDHFSFVNILSIVEMNDATIVGASESGIFYLNTDGSIDKLTKTSGLSDIGVTAMCYFENFDAIVLGYENGNVDIIVNGNVANISDIKRKNISGDKSIYSITNQEGFAILSCGFGIVKIDVQNAEITDTYYIGVDASFVEVSKTISFGDSIYAATSEGLYVANTNDFLADYNNWYLINTISYTNFSDVSMFNNNLYAIVNNGSSSQFVKRNDNYTWTEIESEIKDESKIFVEDNLYIATGETIRVYNNNDVFIEEINQYNGDWAIHPQFVGIANDGRMLIGDKNTGLVIHTNSTNNFYYPSGVYLNEVVQVKAIEDFVIATRGGFRITGANLGNIGTVNFLSNSEWTKKTQYQGRDFYCILQDESNSEHYYIGSWGYGVFEYNKGQLQNQYNADNSPLESIISGDYIRISGIDYDSDKNIWMINHANVNPINVLKTDGTWASFFLDGKIAQKETRNLIVTENNLVCAIVYKNGLIALNFNNTIDNEDDDVSRFFYPIDEEGNRIGNDVKCLIEDKKGDIWFGTDEGVGVMFNPENFNEEGYTANRIKITDYLNDSLVTNYLLKEEIVFSIAVDGGNRKWLGTGNSGVYLMNETGTKQILHFNTENSPLPSNKVISIDIEPKTGEVFFATSKGLVSYRGDAIEANNQFENVYVFPNPIHHDYYGNITITGLVYESNVKITDIAGTIVYETTSNGGQATWDGNDFSGNRVHTGVYLVFCTNNDGSETFVTKLLFIN